jgi:hypothetical protein
MKVARPIPARRVFAQGDALSARAIGGPWRDRPWRQEPDVRHLEPAVNRFASDGAPSATTPFAGSPCGLRVAIKAACPCSAQMQNGLSSGSGDTSVAKPTSKSSASSLSRLTTLPIRLCRTPGLARTSLYSARMSSVTSHVKVAFSSRSARRLDSGWPAGT